jgi:transcriptional regulator
MYKLPHFTEHDRERIVDFMKQYPFAIVAGITKTYPVATHIPLSVSIVDDRMFLHGHIKRKSDHHIAFEKNNNVLVIFNGPHCYVSASWYTNPLQASTWNYMTVHAKGNLQFTDEAGTIAAIKEVTERFEGKDTAAAFDKMNSHYIEQMAKAIIGVTIEIKSLEAVFKLSQNKDAATRENIITQLANSNDADSNKIAVAMRQFNT